MKDYIKENRQVIIELLNAISATDIDSTSVVLDGAIELAIRLIQGQAKKGNKLALVGNGASAAIASHIATDFWKNAGIKAVAFNDASGLTCISNDFGYKHVFEKPIDMFGEEGDILIAISSSGRSENILRAVKAARKKRMKVITLSGFSDDNPLRKLGEINFYVPSLNYGTVEVIHHSICHCFIDVIIQNKSILKEKVECHE